MGFLDRAKEKIKIASTGFGEETVRKVDYDEIASQKDEKTLHVKKIKPAAPEKQKTSFSPMSKLESGFKILSDKAKEVKPEVKKNTQDKVPKESKKAGVDIQAGKITDVLEVLSIPETFSIPANVLLPSDLKEVKFDMQIPKGYDVGQVNTFTEKVSSSLAYLVSLLKQRNEHIAKLATTIDRLEVDLSNHSFESELASGVNIMPSDSDDNILNQNIELKLQNKRLQDLLEESVPRDEASEEDLEGFKILQDNLSLANRSIIGKDAEIYELKNRLAYLEEGGSFDVEDDEPLVDEAPTLEVEEPNFLESFAEGLEVFSDESKDEENDETELPSFSFIDDESSTQTEYKSVNSAFAGLDDDDDFMSALPMESNSEPSTTTKIDFESSEFSESARLRAIQEEEDGEDDFSRLMDGKWSDS